MKTPQPFPPEGSGRFRKDIELSSHSPPSFEGRSLLHLQKLKKIKSKVIQQLHMYCVFKVSRGDRWLL